MHENDILQESFPTNHEHHELPIMPFNQINASTPFSALYIIFVVILEKIH